MSELYATLFNLLLFITGIAATATVVALLLYKKIPHLAAIAAKIGSLPIAITILGWFTVLGS